MPDPSVRETAGRGTFARDLGVFDASMIGIGAMIGAGIFVPTGIATGEAGPSAIPEAGVEGRVGEMRNANSEMQEEDPHLEHTARRAKC